MTCDKDRTRFAFGGVRDVIPALGRANSIEPLPDLDESNVISCNPLHIVWSGSAPLRYPVAEVGNLIGFEAEEYFPPPEGPEEPFDPDAPVDPDAP